MGFSFKDLKKLVRNEALLKLAYSFDTNNDKKLDDNEMSIFESHVYKGVKNNIFNKEEYFSIFKHDISERISQNNIGVIGNSSNAQNVIIASPDVRINTDAKFRDDGTLQDPTKTISGAILLKDADGKQHKIMLAINPKQIKGLSGENPEEYLQLIINKLSQAINKLPEEVKSDFINEINQINIGGQKYEMNTGAYAGFTKGNGSFEGTDGIINLNILGYNDSSLTSTALIHEIGHSIDHLSGKYQSDNDLKTKYENLKNVLQAKGFDVDNYNRERNVQGYWLKNSKEIVAEFYEYYYLAESNNLNDRYAGNSRYAMLHKAATSYDPEIQLAFKEFETEFVNIINNSRSLDPETRKGNGIEGTLARIDSTKVKITDNRDAYIGFASLPDLVKTENIDLVEVSANSLLKEYYTYSNKCNTNEEWNRIFKELETNNPKEWIAVKTYFNNILDRLSANNKA